MLLSFQDTTSRRSFVENTATGSFQHRPNFALRRKFPRSSEISDLESTEIGRHLHQHEAHTRHFTLYVADFTKLASLPWLQHPDPRCSSILLTPPHAVNDR